MISNIILITINNYNFYFQRFAEVNPEFLCTYYPNLGNNWFVLKDDGDYLCLKFNKDIMQPLIFKGWEQLKELYNLPHNVEVVFSYYGKNIFEIKSFKELHPAATIPSFHSRSAHPTETIYFDLTLTDRKIRKQQLVKYFIF